MTLPPVPKPKTILHVYKLIGGHPDGYEFHGVAYPIGQRVITVYADTEQEVRARIKRMLKC